MAACWAVDISNEEFEVSTSKRPLPKVRNGFMRSVSQAAVGNARARLKGRLALRHRHLVDLETFPAMPALVVAGLPFSWRVLGTGERSCPFHRPNVRIRRRNS